MKVTEHKTDLGKRAIYNFHVRDDMNDVKVSPSVVDCWYPTSPKQEEILILNKMRNLSEGFDGTPVKIAESRLCLLFMTGNYSKTSNGMYVFDQNGIILHNPLILYGAETKTTLYGTGTTSDNWFIKLWIVAKYPKIVFATYQCEKKTSEVKKCDTIINSMNFSF